MRLADEEFDRKLWDAVTKRYRFDRESFAKLSRGEREIIYQLYGRYRDAAS